MVVMFVVVVLVVDGTFGTIPTVGILQGTRYLILPEPLLVNLLTPSTILYFYCRSQKSKIGRIFAKLF
jgi:hypothetical protein